MAVVPIIMAASAAISAIGAIRQGQAADAAARFNATVAEQNAGIARQQAAANAEQIQRQNLLRMGSLAAAQGKSGGNMSGSVVDVLGDVAAQGELERQNAIYGGELQARGFQNTATLDRSQGENAVTSSYFKAGGELLSAGTNYYSMNSKMTRTG